MTNINYRAGNTFSCFKGECDAEIAMHGYFWCSQVCPKCLAIYRASSGVQQVIVPDFSAWFDDKDSVRANIANNGGQYVPTF